MSVAETVTVLIGSLYCTDWDEGVAVSWRGASLTGLTVIDTVVFGDDVFAASHGAELHPAGSPVSVTV